MPKNHFTFRPLTEDDLPVLAEWLNRPHLQQWWRSGETTLDKVREKYLPRIFHEDTARPFLAHLNDKAVGYIQYYKAWKGDPAWWPDEPGAGVLGIDQFLADERNLDKGLGTALVRQFVGFLQNEEYPALTEIRVDPRPDNPRAIRCYEKAGFKKTGTITTLDGPAVMMVLKP